MLEIAKKIVIKMPQGINDNDISRCNVNNISVESFRTIPNGRRTTGITSCLFPG